MFDNVKFLKLIFKSRCFKKTFGVKNIELNNGYNYIWFLLT